MYVCMHVYIYIYIYISSGLSMSHGNPLMAVFLFSSIVVTLIVVLEATPHKTAAV